MTEHEHIQRNRVELTEALQRVFQRWHSISDVVLLGEALGISAAEITARPPSLRERLARIGGDMSPMNPSTTRPADSK